MTDDQTPSPDHLPTEAVIPTFAGGVATRESLAELTAAVDRLSDEATDLRTQLRSRTRALWTAVTVGGIVLAVVLAAAIAVTLNNRQAIAANNGKFCGLVASSASTFPAPSTPRGQALQGAAVRLLRDLDCKQP